MEQRPKIIFFNQMAGLLFRELAQEMAREWGHGILYTGHPDTLRCGGTDKLTVIKAPVYNKRSLTKRFLSWLLYFFFAFYHALTAPRTALLFFSTNPPIIPIIGFINKKLFAKHYIVLVYDIYPEIPIALGWIRKNGLVAKTWRCLNKLSYEHADAGFTIGEYMAKNLERQFDPKKTRLGKIEVVPTWVDTAFIKPIKKSENWFAKKYNQVDKLTILFSGNLGATNGIENIIELAGALKKEEKIHFLVIGDGYKRESFEARCKKEGLLNLTLLPPQPESFLPYSLATGDIAIITMAPGTEGYMVSSSFPYYLAAGCYLWYFGTHESEIGSLCDRSGLGMVIQSDSFTTERLKDSLRLLIQNGNLPTSAFEFANAKYSKSVNIKKFFSIKAWSNC